MIKYVIISTIILTTLFSISTIPAFADEQRTDFGDVNLNDFYFIDDTTGWIVGDGGLVLRTIDGGNNWVDLPVIIDGNTELDNLNGVHFYDDQNGIVVGDTSGFVYVTDDAGDTWTSQTFDKGGEIADAGIMNDVFMYDATHVWVVADDDYLAWYNVDDWNEVELFPADDVHVDINRVFFIDEDHGWAVGDGDRTILTTIDSGEYWSEPEVRVGDGDYVDVFFTDVDNGWIITSTGLILYSSNEGQSWFSDDIVDEFSSETLRDIFFLDNTNGWIVGDGIKLVTSDGGNTWTKYDSSYDSMRVQYHTSTNGFILDTAGITRITSSTGDDTDDSKKRSGGGCNDCTPPTLGLDKNGKRLVDNGFTYNGDSTQVGKYHTPYPLINATVGEMNLVSIKAYENGGIYNMHRVQFGLGAEEIGVSLNSLEVLIDVELLTDGTTTGIQVDKIVINDKDNLIDNDTVSATASIVTCQSTDVTPNCINVNLEYSYREATINHVMVVNVEDKKHNAQNFYFNDGVQVLGESLNPALTYAMYNKKIAQQTENLTIQLTRVDKVNHLWIDDNGVEYLKISEDRFDRITPTELYRCTDDYIIKTVVKRTNVCQFLPLLNYEITRAENTMNAILSSSNLDAIVSWDHNNKALRQYE